MAGVVDMSRISDVIARRQKESSSVKKKILTQSHPGDLPVPRREIPFIAVIDQQHDGQRQDDSERVLQRSPEGVIRIMIMIRIHCGAHAPQSGVVEQRTRRLKSLDHGALPESSRDEVRACRSV